MPTWSVPPSRSVVSVRPRVAAATVSGPAAATMVGAATAVAGTAAATAVAAAAVPAAPARKAPREGVMDSVLRSSGSGRWLTLRPTAAKSSCSGVPSSARFDGMIRYLRRGT